MASEYAKTVVAHGARAIRSRFTSNEQRAKLFFGLEDASIIAVYISDGVPHTATKEVQET